VILATLLLAATLGRTEEALRQSMYSIGALIAGRRTGFPHIIDRTEQPNADYVEAMADDVPDSELRNEMVKPHAPVSLRPIFKVGRKITTPAEVESVIRGGTPQERLDRFKQRYPNGLLRMSAVGQKPHSILAFVTYELIAAHIDQQGDFQLAPVEIGLVELVPDWQVGWKVENMHSVALDH